MFLSVFGFSHASNRDSTTIPQSDSVRSSRYLPSRHVEQYNNARFQPQLLTASLGIRRSSYVHVHARHLSRPRFQAERRHGKKSDKERRSASAQVGSHFLRSTPLAVCDTPTPARYALHCIAGLRREPALRVQSILKLYVVCQGFIETTCLAGRRRSTPMVTCCITKDPRRKEGREGEQGAAWESRLALDTYNSRLGWWKKRSRRCKRKDEARCNSFF